MYRNCYHFISLIKRLINKINNSYLHSTLGYYGKNVYFSNPLYVRGNHKVFLYDNCSIQPNATIIINPLGDSGRFIMKPWAFTSTNLTVITGNHNRKVGKYLKQLSCTHIGDIDKDVIIEEDAWIGANVTLLPGVIIGRCATIGAGSVVTKSLPPYSVCVGIPAKVVKFYWTIDEILEHEKQLYAPEERMTRTELETIFSKYVK